MLQAARFRPPPTAPAAAAAAPPPQDLSRAWRVSEALQYGMIGVNEVAITAEVGAVGGGRALGSTLAANSAGVLCPPPADQLPRASALAPPTGGALWWHEAERHGAGAEQVWAGRVPGHQVGMPRHRPAHVNAAVNATAAQPAQATVPAAPAHATHCKGYREVLPEDSERKVQETSKEGSIKWGWLGVALKIQSQGGTPGSALPQRTAAVRPLSGLLALAVAEVYLLPPLQRRLGRRHGHGR